MTQVVTGEWTAGGEHAYVPPATDTERALAGLFAEVLALPVDEVGSQDSFFDLGGHSLLAMALVTRVAEEYGVEIGLRELFARPTVAGVAALLAEAADPAPHSDPAGTDRQPAGPEPADPGPGGVPPARAVGVAAVAGAPPVAGGPPVVGVPPVAAVPRTGDLPLSYGQQRLWFFEQLRPGTDTYNLPVVLRLRGQLDVAALRTALAAVVERHEVLRSVFVDGGDGPVLRIPDAVTVPLVTEDVSAAADPGAEAVRRAAGHVRRGFDLAEGPLVRAVLLELGPADRVLVLVFHHIVMDGYSIPVVVGDLVHSYQLALAGGSTHLPALPVQYADFAVWQRRWLASGVLDRQLAYWREQLAGAPELLALPTDRPRPAVASFRGGRVPIAVDADLRERLRRVCAREGLTPFMVLLAAYSVVLGRLAGVTDVVVGAPIAGRPRRELDALAGFFVNTLVLRTDLSSRPSVRDVLARVRDTALEAYANQDVPFERLVAQLRPQRELSHAPLFQVMLNLQTAAPVELSVGDLRWTAEQPEEADSTFDMTLYAVDRPDALDLDLVYNADLFDADRMAALAVQFGEVLDFLLGDPDASVDALALHRAGPARPLGAAPAGTVLDAFDAAVRAGPDRLALVDEGGAGTYADLDGMVTRLAERLRAAGVGRDQVVLLCGTRDRRLLAGLLAAWRVGCVPALVDAALPGARIAGFAGLLRPAAVLRPAAGDLLVEAGSHPATLAGAEPCSYVLFTSGSTGEPKAVLTGGGPLTRFLDWYRDTFALTAEDRFAVLSGLGHDPLLRDALAPIWVGAASCWPGGDLLREPAGVAGWLAGRGVTVANLTPALGELLCLAPDGALWPARLLCCGGDALHRGLVRRLHRLAPAAEIVNCYGATETPQVVGYHRMPAGDPGDPGGEGPVPLGVGANGAILDVRTAAGRPAGTGELGEIWVRSPYLAAGYLTAGPDGPRLQPLPAPDGPGGYPTGDLGRFRPDGTVDCHGRRDRQLSVRGFRVEPAEIERVLAGLPGIAECAVTPAPADTGTPAPAGAPDAGDAGGGQPREELWACVVPGAGAAPDPDTIRAGLRAELPEYMVPRVLVGPDPLPRRENGKLDLPGLRRLVVERAPRPVLVAEPRDELELVLVELWSAVLGGPPAHLTESFFDRGDSLLLTQYVVRVNTVLGAQLSVATAFTAPTVDRLAALLRGGPAEAAAIAVVRSVTDDPGSEP